MKVNQITGTGKQLTVFPETESEQSGERGVKTAQRGCVHCLFSSRFVLSASFSPPLPHQPLPSILSVSFSKHHYLTRAETPLFLRLHIYILTSFTRFGSFLLSQHSQLASVHLDDVYFYLRQEGICFCEHLCLFDL